MPQPPESASDARGLFRRRTGPPAADWEVARAEERAASLAILRRRQRDERRAQRMRRLISWWPVGAGLMAGCAAPLLERAAQFFAPWGMTLVFPLVVLAQRPELQAGGPMHLLPAAMLYGQFPLEGLLARAMLRRQTRALPVAGQALLLHLLGVAEVLLLNGAVEALARHAGVTVPR
jgi:hypothetical protein